MKTYVLTNHYPSPQNLLIPTIMCILHFPWMIK